MHLLKVYILTRDRPDYLKEAIDSFKKQSFQDFDLEISDNSSSEDTFKIIPKNYSKVAITRRIPNLSSFEHFNAVRKEALSSNYQYFIFFHDDDVAKEDYLKFSFNMIQNSDALAVGTNGFFLRDNKPLKKIMNIHKDKTLCNPRDVLSFYFNYKYSDTAPYPSYIFTKEAVKAIDKFGLPGKYNDVIQILSISHKGKLIWIKEPLLYYRIHNNQDSFSNRISDRIKLVSLLRKNNFLKLNDDLLQSYKFRYLLNAFRKKQISRRKKRVIFKYLFLNFPLFFFRNIQGFLLRKYFELLKL